jgi:hypothetical protein
MWMLDETVSHTAYFILSPSGDFASQAYNIILYQWMHVLEKQGVSKEHVFAWARNIDGVTLLHPKPSITDDPLHPPEGWEERLMIGSTFEQGTSQLFNTLADWGRDMSVSRVVVIVVGTGDSMSVFSGNGELDPVAFGSIQSNCGNKPVLLVLDFDGSWLFASSAAAQTEGEVFYLTSGKYLSQKTAVVLCDNTDKIAEAPGSAKIRYAIYSTMFHRSLFQLVVFTPTNPKLMEIAELLNAPIPGLPGFFSQSTSCGHGWENMNLRDFFGDPVDPTALRGILASRPSEGFIDDLDRFVDHHGDYEHQLLPVLNDFVRFEFDDQGTPRLVGHGEWRSINPVHEAVQSHIDLGPSLSPLRGHFPDVEVMGTAVDLLLERMEDKGASFLASRVESVRLSDKDMQKWIRIRKFLMRENEPRPRSIWEVDEFCSYIDLTDLEGWCHAIREAQETLCKEFPRVGRRQRAEL